MAMKHDACTHARTPAGRAQCRKDQALEGRRQNTLDRTVVPAQKARAKAPESVRKAAARVAGTRHRTLREMTPLRTSADFTRCEVPEALQTPVRFAWNAGWDAQTGSPYNVDQKVIQITNAHGTLSLVWSSDDDAITDVQWRAIDTSVTRRITDIPEGVKLLSGN